MSTKRILINKTDEQLRIARVEGQTLYDLEIESSHRKQKVNDIFNAKVVSIQPSLEAAFVNFGANRNGFLPLREVAPEYYNNKTSDLKITDVLSEGQKILIQVNKEERGTKGAAVSSYITLAGSYLVFMPNNPKTTGISRRIEGDERDDLKKTLHGIQMPEDIHGGIIVRTAGMGKSTEELQWDLDVLVNLWRSIQAASKQHDAPYMIHQESDIATRAIRDHLRPDIGEILVDDPDTYGKLRGYIERTRANFTDKVKLYTDVTPLFSRFQIEKQIERAFGRKIQLPSGGEIVIDRTEALTAIDVNSARATKGKHIEETALHTNLEATQEIAKQLRIRDLGGLFVIDYIDMAEKENNRKVEDALHEALKADRARTQTTRISRFGLLEMSRQRLRPALHEAEQIICPQCHGQGTIRNIQSQTHSMVRLIEENALKPNIKAIHVQLPIPIATYMLNELYSSIQKIEMRHNLTIVVIPNPYLNPPQYEINTISKKETESKNEPLSYELMSLPKLLYTAEASKQAGKERLLEPAVKSILPPKNPLDDVRREKTKKQGLIKRVIGALQKKTKQEETEKQQPKKHSRKHTHRRPTTRKHTSAKPTEPRSRNTTAHKKTPQKHTAKTQPSPRGNAKKHNSRYPGMRRKNNSAQKDTVRTPDSDGLVMVETKKDRDTMRENTEK